MGHSDGMLVKAGSGVMTAGIPDSLGSRGGCAADTLTAVYNDLDSVEQLFQQHRGDVAAVILEPVAANMGGRAAKRRIFAKTAEHVRYQWSALDLR